MENLYNHAYQIILEAGEKLKLAFFSEKKISQKSNAYDLVTETDKAIEQYLIQEFTKLVPESRFLAEESDSAHKKAEYLWIIDPIDGTSNFVHRFPFVCISVAFLVNGIHEMAFIYNPILNEYYTAQKDQGAFLNGKQIQVSSENDFSRSLLGTGFSYNFMTAPVDNIKIYKELLGKVHGIRRPGSAALDMCHVAKGVYEGYWEWYLNPWDVSAGLLIIEEAGGIVSNLEGERWSFSDDVIVCSNRLIHQTLINEIKEAKNK